MTREEAIYCMRSYLPEREGAIEDCPKCKYYGDCKSAEAHKMAIEALSAEPCEDAISRQAVIEAIMTNCIWENEYNLTSSRIKKAVESLPPVTPKSKMGHWIRCDILQEFKCSECRMCFRDKSNFCPNCGAKMEGSENG